MTDDLKMLLKLYASLRDVATDDYSEELRKRPVESLVLTLEWFKDDGETEVRFFRLSEGIKDIAVAIHQATRYPNRIWLRYGDTDEAVYLLH